MNYELLRLSYQRGNSQFDEKHCCKRSKTLSQHEPYCYSRKQTVPN